MSRSEKSASTGRGGWAWTDPLVFVVLLAAMSPILYVLAEIAIRLVVGPTR